jgi:hypothetical protein
MATVSRIDPWMNAFTDGYMITAAFVEVIPGGTAPNPVLVSVPIGQDFNLTGQTGYLQVRYQTTTAPMNAISGPYPGYDFRARAGVDGQNTHSLIFDISPNVPLTQNITYRNFADTGGRPLAAGGVSQPDTIQSASQPTPFGPAGIADATISGPLVPEPSAGLLAAGAGMLLAARRRRARR